MNIKETFDWGKSSEFFIRHVMAEANDSVYEKIFQVNEGDIVVDAGTSVGPFLHSIMDKKPARCYAIEPILANHQTIINNTNDQVVMINRALTELDEVQIEWDGSVQIVKGLTFDTFIKDWLIERIDFLKTDCEGGEYTIFKPENLPWLLDNCKYCVGEWHLRDAEEKELFRKFRDTILPQFKSVRVFSVDGVDIQWDLYNEHFLEYYTEVIMHIEL